MLIVMLMVLLYTVAVPPPISDIRPCGGFHNLSSSAFTKEKHPPGVVGWRRRSLSVRDPHVFLSLTVFSTSLLWRLDI